MNLFKTFVFVFSIIPSCYAVKAQDCFNYYKDSCKTPYTKFTYSLNKSSISFLFKSGEKREVPFTVYSGKDYRVTICSQEVFSGVVMFRLVGVEGGRVYYDNSVDEFNTHIEFVNKKTNDLYVEITAPEPTKGTADTIYYEGCIGVIIEEMNSIKTGF